MSTIAHGPRPLPTRRPKAALWLAVAILAATVALTLALTHHGSAQDQSSAAVRPAPGVGYEGDRRSSGPRNEPASPISPANRYGRP
jgi:hypothetical protein